MHRFLLFTSLLILSTTSYAQQFVAVKVEAENYSSKHPDWRRFSSTSTPNVRPDPDGSHAGSASGRAYMELLPDTRVSHSDRLVSNGNFWNEAGTGPSLTYTVNIPEPGRYIVFAKAYSTGTEDNGIHVGLNNRNPSSGHRMQWCSGKNKWTWGSAQRTSSNHCGSPRTIYLDFTFAGANTVTFSAREDGFELDQFILLKTNNNSCAPNDRDQIVCNTGTTNISSQNTPTEPQQPAPVITTPVQPAAAPSVVPAPATPAPVVTAVISTPVSDDLPMCSSQSSDSDGDGYGWENNRSCVTASSTSTSGTTAAAPQSTIPVCTSAASDSDGDGYGWEQNRSCRVAAGTSTATSQTSTPVCSSATSDSDGDGWGWENSQSCLVQ